VTLIGASGSGKSTFATRHFRETEVLSSDRCRALVADSETDQSATADAFDILYGIAAKRLASRRLSVIDATNLRPEDRAKGIAVARTYHALPVAIVFDLHPDISVARNRTRAERDFGAKVVWNHVRLLRKSLARRRLHLRGGLYRVTFFVIAPSISSRPRRVQRDGPRPMMRRSYQSRSGSSGRVGTIAGAVGGREWTRAAHSDGHEGRCEETPTALRCSLMMMECP